MSIWRDPDGALFHEECLPAKRADFTQVLEENLDEYEDEVCAACHDELLDLEEDEEEEDEA